MVENNVIVDKFEKRTVIKYLFLKGLSGKAIHDDMLATLGDSDAASTENVQIVDDMLKEDRHRTIRHIAETTDIHATTVYRIYQVILV